MHNPCLHQARLGRSQVPCKRHGRAASSILPSMQRAGQNVEDVLDKFKSRSKSNPHPQSLLSSARQDRLWRPSAATPATRPQPSPTLTRPHTNQAACAILCGCQSHLHPPLPTTQPVFASFCRVGCHEQPKAIPSRSRLMPFLLLWGSASAFVYLLDCDAHGCLRQRRIPDAYFLP